jgi:hypothetical protein
VLDARTLTRNQILHTPRNRVELMGVAKMNPNTLIFDAQDYALILRSISAQGCPSDFCRAWSDYVSAWNFRARTSPNPVYVLQAGLTPAQSETAGAFDEGGDSKSGGETRTVTAWQTVQEVSARYGAQAE